MLKKLTPKEIMLDLLDDIESGRIELDMTSFTHRCGSPACIAGHIVYRHGNFEEASRVAGVFNYQAGEILGLTNKETNCMFLGCGEDMNLDSLTPLVPDMIRHWIETGEVVWKCPE